mmetsp:Transcript_79465/g.219817  ORF Transcript_79465/g.219817 Transcript_79465/m.219817 type:complete len:575 (-) Transcript_79465:60-1784(-)
MLDNASFASDTSSEEPVARLTSLKLSRPELLRGTRVSVVLAGYGKRLGSHASSPLDYEESVPVSRLDMFLSYSRHSSSWAKFIALKFSFHGWPAFLMAALLGLCTWMIRRVVAWRTYLGHCNFHTGVWNDFGPCFGSLFIYNGNSVMQSGEWKWKPLCLPVGMAAFCLTFSGWGLITRWCLPARFIFLDTVCIHQTDAITRDEGIKSLGAVLAHTEVMVVAWDSTYFSRLWCVYEVGAFRAANPRGRVDFLPVELGMFLAVVLVGSTLGLCTVGVLSAYGLRQFMVFKVLLPLDNLLQLRGWHWIAIGIYAVPLGLSTVVVMWVLPNVRTYLQFRDKMEADLSAFSVGKARCFCCDCGHVHPATGEALPCDREAIYSSIRHWYGGSLDEFEASIRGHFKDDVNRMMGPLLPYSYAVFIGLPYFLAWLDFAHCCPSCALPLGVARLLLQAPLDVFLLLSVCRRLKGVNCETLGRCCYCVALPAMSALVVSSVAILEFAVDWILQQCHHSFASWLVITLIELGLAGLVYGADADTWKLRAFSCWRMPCSRWTDAAVELELPQVQTARQSGLGSTHR